MHTTNNTMIYKLKYPSKEVADQDLLQKGVLINVTDLQGEEVMVYAPNTHAVVYVGLIVDTPAVMDGMEVVIDATYLSGWHIDVMTEEEVVFENEIIVNNPRHKFAGQ